MRDLHDAWRAVCARPMVAMVTVITLALGIGANTAVFWILDGLLLAPLPVDDPTRLVLVGPTDANAPNVTYPVWQEIRSREILRQAFAWGADRVDLAESGERMPVDAIWASGGVFEVLGIPAAVGRTFDGRDDRRGGGENGPVAVLGYRFWRQHFGGDAGAIGRMLTVERVPFTIVGVTPPGFLGPEVGTRFDIVLPLETESVIGRSPERLDNRFWPWLRVMARLDPGATVEETTGKLRAAHSEIREATMPGYSRGEDRDAYLKQPLVARAAPGGSSQLRGRYVSALLTLFGLVGLILLVACTNLATLLLAHLRARRHELSVRLALGASRLRLLRQLTAESLLPSAIGGALGLALAYGGSGLLVRQLETWARTVSLDLSLDWRVLGFTVGTTLTTVIVFGALPALSAMRAQPADALRDHARARGGGVWRFGNTLVVVQVAVSVVLVVGAGLFVQSFGALVYRDLGFDRDRVLVVVVDARRSAVPPGRRTDLYERLREAAGAVPAIESAAASMATPIGSVGNMRWMPRISVPGGPAVAGREGKILANRISPGWFRTFGTRLVAGRDFGARDRMGLAPVAIVNQAFAREYFGNTDPLGRLVVVEEGASPRSLRIVGVAADAAYTSVRDAAEATLYTPLAQMADANLLAAFPFISISVRPRGDRPDGVARALASAIGRVDPDLSFTVRRLSDQLNVFYIRERLLAMLSGFLGLLALFLAAMGVYAVTTHAVVGRRTEIAVRMALGARPSSVTRLILGKAAALAGLGTLVGAGAGLWASRFVRTLLFGVVATDARTFFVAAVLLGLVACGASLLAARRAARTDPAAVLREG